MTASASSHVPDGASLNPSLGDFDAYARSYSEAVNQSLAFSGLSVDYFTKVKAAYLLEIMAEQSVPENQTVLDVGCGVGNYHGLIGPAVGKLSGIDVSAECLVTARQRHPEVTYSHFDGLRIPFEDSSFDLAFAICVYHHVPETMRPQLTQDVFRVLKPGGRLVIFEHNPLNPLTMRVVNNCSFDADAVLLKHKDARGLLEAARFTQVKARSILSVPAASRVMRQVDRAFSLLPLGAQFYAVGTKPAALT
jgi:ubiquinone/menaquinone biosynthesis C-methylase UbiE